MKKMSTQKGESSKAKEKFNLNMSPPIKMIEREEGIDLNVILATETKKNEETVPY